MTEKFGKKKNKEENMQATRRWKNRNKKVTVDFRGPKKISISSFISPPTSCSATIFLGSEYHLVLQIMAGGFLQQAIRPA